MDTVVWWSDSFSPYLKLRFPGMQKSDERITDEASASDIKQTGHMKPRRQKGDVPRSKCNPERNQSILACPIHLNTQRCIRYTGRGRSGGEGLEISPSRTDFYCHDMTPVLQSMPWEERMDPENPIDREIELHPPHEVIPTETHRPEEK